MGILVISSILGQVAGVGSIRIHQLDFPVAIAIRLKNDLPPIRRPGRRPIGALIAGQAVQPTAVDVYDEDVG